VSGDRLSVYQTVLQSYMCHPDWSVETHIAYPDSEWWQTDDWRTTITPSAIGVATPEEAVAKWVARHRETVRLDTRGGLPA